MDYWWPAKPHKWFESSLSTTTFAASLANPVTLRALQLRADVNQRSAANRASRLARFFALLNIRLYGVSAWVLFLLGLHGIGPLLR
jgi:hypothetical protein